MIEDTGSGKNTLNQDHLGTSPQAACLMADSALSDDEIFAQDAPSTSKEALNTATFRQWHLRDWFFACSAIGVAFTASRVVGHVIVFGLVDFALILWIVYKSNLRSMVTGGLLAFLLALLTMPLLFCLLPAHGTEEKIVVALIPILCYLAGGTIAQFSDLDNF